MHALLPILMAPQTWMAFVFGALIGSFLNVCIYRIPEGTFWRHTRSVCRACGAPIPAYLNIPIFAYFILRGRTNCCQSRLSFQYPMVELITAIAFVMIYWHLPFLGFSKGEIIFDAGQFIRASHLAVFFCLLMVCSVIDIHLMIIPDVISIPMILLTPVIAWIHPDLSMTSALLGAFFGGLSLYLVAWAYWLVRNEIGLGFGDVKLLAAIGGWLGMTSLLPTILYGSVIGTLFAFVLMIWKRSVTLQSALPFGPFLAIGAILHAFYGSRIQMWIEMLTQPAGGWR